MKAYHYFLSYFVVLCLWISCSPVWAQVQVFRPGEEGIFTPSTCNSNADCDDLDNTTLDYCGPDGCFNMTNKGLPDLQIRNLSFHPISGLWIQYNQGMAHRSPLQDQYWYQLNSDFPLLSSYGSATVATSTGDIWVEGVDDSYDFTLARYEASSQSWTTIHLPSVGFPDLWPNTLCVDQNDVLWIGDNNGKIVSFDGNTWTQFDVASILNLTGEDRFRRILTDSNGHIWAVSDVLAGNLRLYHYDGQNWTYFIAPGNKYPTGMWIAPGGKVYITTNTDKIITFENGVWGNIPGLNASYFYDIESAGGQKLWAATSDGLYYYDGNIWTLYNTSNSGLLQNWLEQITSDTINGEVYIDYRATSEGIQRWSTITVFDGSTWTHIEPTTEARPSDQRDLRMDPQGRPWLMPIVGSFAITPEIVLRDGNQWNFLSDATEGVNDVVWDGNGDSWMVAGDPTHAVTKYDGTNYTIYDHT
ncbi:MAG: hypothetical protein AAFR59_14020, partial [Bacteroidota bacterium]